MPQYESKVLQASTRPEWLAKTYSEYLYACAQDVAELNSAINDACCDEALDTLIEAYRATWDENYSLIDREMANFALTHGCTVEDVETKSASYQAVLADYVPSSEALSCAQTLVDTFTAMPNTPAEVIEHVRRENMNCDNFVASQWDVYSRIVDLTTNIRDQFHLPNDYQFSLVDGYTSFRTLCQQVIQNICLELSDPSISLTMKSSTGESLPAVSYQLTELVEAMKDAVTSNIAWAQGFASCAIANISDRLANFNETIKCTYSAAYTEAKEAFNNVRAFLSQANLTVSSFISQAEEAIGFNKRDTSSVISETDVAAYTGASPLSGIDFHTAKGLASATATVVVGAVKGIWAGIKKIANKVWGKVRPYVMAITNDPEDLKVIDSNADSYHIEGWAINNGSRVAQFDLEFISQETATAAMEYLQRYVDKTIAFDCYASATTIQFKSFSILIAGGKYYLRVEYLYKLKPRVLNYKTLEKSNMIAFTSGGMMHLPPVRDYSLYVENWKNLNDFFLPDDSTEEDFLTGIFASLLATWGIASSQLGDWMDYVHTHTPDGWNGNLRLVRRSSTAIYTPPTGLSIYPDSDGDVSASERYNYGVDPDTHQVNFYLSNQSQNLENIDFLKAAGGYRVGSWGTGEAPFDSEADIDDFDCALTAKLSVIQGQVGYVPVNRDFSDIASFFAAFFCLQQYDRLLHPGDFIFLPYTNDTYEFATPRYAIKTDAENLAIAESFASIVLVVVVIAVAVIIGKVVACTLTKAKFKRWTAKKGALDQQLWNGNKLTRSQWRTYLRADRKLSKINLWSKGVSAATMITGDSPSGALTNLLSNNGNSPLSENDAAQWYSSAERNDVSQVYYQLTRSYLNV